MMATTATPAVTIRLLSPDEYPRLLATPPFQALGIVPDPAHSRVLVVETDEGQILGSWTLHDTVHAEPLYLDPSVRDNWGVGRGLLEAVLEQLCLHDVHAAFVLIDPLNEVVRKMAELLGFVRLPGIPYALELPLARAMKASATPQESA